MADNQSGDKLQKLRRAIFLSSEIDEQSAKDVVQALLRMEIENPSRDVILIIDSPGGCVDSMWSIVDAMNLLHCGVNTLVIGKAMSAAATVLLSGAKGRRYATPHSRIMLHQTNGRVSGSNSFIKNYCKEMDRQLEEMFAHILERTNIPSDLFEQKRRDDWYVTPSEAVELGVVDKVITKFSEMDMPGW